MICAALLAVLLLQISPVAAEEGTQMQLQLTQDVVYCTAKLSGQRERLVAALRDGMVVSTVWRIQLDRLRHYWLNESVAEITVVRRVEPDLLAQRWRLVDEATGIARQSDSLDAALHFLTAIEHVAVVDRALLVAGESYRAGVAIDLRLGDAGEAWWTALWRTDEATMAQRFHLPANSAPVEP